MHRVLPDPSLSLAFRCRRDSEGRPVDPLLLVIGPKTRPFLFPFHRGWETIAVRLKLEWAHPLLGLIPAEHSDAEHDLAAIQPSGRLLDQLGETRSSAAAGAVLAGAVLRRACHLPLRATAATRALELVRHTGGSVSVDCIAQWTGSSPRQLRRTVGRDAGISLKRYARITRLLRAVTAADAAMRPAWARIAVECGFCDQSHLVRECRALVGLRPGVVHRERRAEAETSNRG
jgi:AraC-like DNA-binding protein